MIYENQHSMQQKLESSNLVVIKFILVDINKLIYLSVEMNTGNENLNLCFIRLVLYWIIQQKKEHMVYTLNIRKLITGYFQLNLNSC